MDNASHLPPLLRRGPLRLRARPPRSRPPTARILVVLVLVLVATGGFLGALSPGVPGPEHSAAGFEGAPRLGATKSAADVTNGPPSAFGAAVPAAQKSALSGSSVAVGARSTAGAPSSAGQTSTLQPRIEENGSAYVVVPGPQLSGDLDKLMSLATAVGGFVASTSTQSAGAGSPAQVTASLEVPVGAFASVSSEVRDLGRVTSFSTSADDVTGQYVDLQSQITALQDSRQQYLTIMTKATTVGAILAVQAQLDDVDNQLQQLQGQLQVMNNETTYAMLNVTLSQRTVPPPVRHPASGLTKAWNSAVSGFVDGFYGVVRIAGPLIFALLLATALVLAGRWGWRLRRRPPAPGPAPAGNYTEPIQGP